MIQQYSNPTSEIPEFQVQIPSILFYQEYVVQGFLTYSATTTFVNAEALFEIKDGLGMVLFTQTLTNTLDTADGSYSTSYNLTPAQEFSISGPQTIYRRLTVVPFWNGFDILTPQYLSLDKYVCPFYVILKVPASTSTTLFFNLTYSGYNGGNFVVWDGKLEIQKN